MIIDFHVHVGNYGKTKSSNVWAKVTLKVLLEYLDERGIDKAVLLAVESLERKMSGYCYYTSDVIEIYKKFPEKFIPFCSIDPREESLEEKLREYIDAGCKGFGEHKIKLPINHTYNLKLYRLCEKYEIPILIHTDSNYNFDTIGLKNLEEVVKEFSNLTFIMHGPGWWREISTNVSLEIAYPKGKVTPGRVYHFLEEYENVYGDLSAYSGYNALARDLEHAKAFLVKFTNKLLYGSDLVDFFDPKISLIKLLKQLEIPENVRERILWKNAFELLKLNH